MNLSKDVSLNFMFTRLNVKWKKILFICILFYFYSVSVGKRGGGGGVSMAHCKTKTRLRTLVNHNEHRLSNEEIK